MAKKKFVALVLLGCGDETRVRCDSSDADNGVLTLYDKHGQVVARYADGGWLGYEIVKAKKGDRCAGLDDSDLW